MITFPGSSRLMQGAITGIDPVTRWRVSYFSNPTWGIVVRNCMLAKGMKH
jgi:hypothetical protein